MSEGDLSKLKIDKTGLKAQKGSRKKTAIISVIVIAVALLAFLLFGSSFRPAVKVEVVMVSQIYPYQTFTLLNASGYVVAGRKAAVASKTTGRLIAIYVEEGSKVKAGQVIARLESDDVTAVHKQAEAHVEVAKQNLVQAKAELIDAMASFDRSKTLLEKGYIAQSTFDADEARLKKGKAAVAAAEAEVTAAVAGLKAAAVAVEYTNIRAPFDAVVLTKNADVGDIITPLGAAANAKAAVVTIADMSSLLIEADVSESNLEKVKVGQPCEIQLDAMPEERYRGKVHMIVPTADRSKASVMVKIKFLDMDKRVLPEMSAKVAFLERAVAQGERKPKTAINPAAVLSRDGKQFVFLIKDNLASEVAVKIGSRVGDAVEVVEGLNPGDRIVLNPPKYLKSGAKIEEKEK